MTAYQKGVSIHAPREGGDDRRVVKEMTKLEFQSTPPAREATGDGDGDGDGDEFQSTPPAREATPIPAF